MKIAVIGEGMLELSRDAPAGDGWRLGYGGDTLNTAIHLARLGLEVTFLTALGSDPFSDRLRADWAAEGLHLDHVLNDPARLPGLYAIETAADGERSFSYWRNDSAARRLFDLPGIEEALDAASRADLLYFSLISLAVLPDDVRERLYRLCASMRANGGRIAFDSNYRPRLWSDPEAARSCLASAAAVTDIALPTLSDEQPLYGDAGAQASAIRWHELGVQEVVIKLGGDGCLVSQANDAAVHVPACTVPTIVDTSGAGDAFNAGYLVARMSGAEPAKAAIRGHELAAWVVQRTGAIPAADEDAPYSSKHRSGTA